MKRWSFDGQIKAFTLIELLVVFAIVGVLAGVLLPALAKNQMKAQRINCFNNLRGVGLSFRLWADDNNGKYPMRVSVTNGGSMEFVLSGETFRHFQVMSNELSTPKVLACPSDTRLAATNFTTGFFNSKISYFVGVDADEAKMNMLLIGDRNLNGGKQPVNGILSLTSNDIVNWTRAMHKRAGNIALADGHVDQLTTRKLQETLKNSGVATNRLALP